MADPVAGRVGGRYGAPMSVCTRRTSWTVRRYRSSGCGSIENSFEPYKGRDRLSDRENRGQSDTNDDSLAACHSSLSPRAVGQVTATRVVRYPCARPRSNDHRHIGKSPLPAASREPRSKASADRFRHGGQERLRLRQPAPPPRRWKRLVASFRQSLHKLFIAQRIEHLTTDQKVGRSNPPRARADSGSCSAATGVRREAGIPRRIHGVRLAITATARSAASPDITSNRRAFRVMVRNQVFSWFQWLARQD